MTLEVVAFDENGTPLVAGDQRLVSPREWGRNVLSYYIERETRESYVAAGPGWYALTAIYPGGGEVERWRYPVVAWRPAPAQGITEGPEGSATILAPGERSAQPCDARAYCEDCDNEDLVGFFHQDLHPEPDHLATDIERLAAAYYNGRGSTE
jgi:hypothetical protein